MLAILGAIVGWWLAQRRGRAVEEVHAAEAWARARARELIGE